MNSILKDSSEKIRILFVLPSARGGGAERVLINLLRNIDRKQFQANLVLINATGPLLKFIPAYVQIYGLGEKRVGKSLLKLALLIRKMKPDLVLSSISNLNLAVSILKPFFPKKSKLIIRESNMPSLSLEKGLKNALFRILYPFLYPRANHIICPGKAIKKELRDQFRIAPDRMVVIPNPVSIENKSIKHLKNVEIFPNTDMNLLAVGSLTRQKGFDLLIKAMAIVVKKNPAVHLTILGEGPEADKLANQIKLLDLSSFIKLRGFKKNPYPYLCSADLFILSSRFEGLPNVVLESLACGTPVVAFDCPGSVTEILEVPEQGMLVPNGEVSALAEAILSWKKGKTKLPRKSLLPPQFMAPSVTKKYENLFFSCTKNKVSST